MPMTPEEIKRAEAALDAEEQALKEKRCVIRGHRWDLPAMSPFNDGHLTSCETICSRCNAHATVSITVRDSSKK
jgi:hypothetical protein